MNLLRYPPLHVEGIPQADVGGGGTDLRLIFTGLYDPMTGALVEGGQIRIFQDRKSTRLNSSHAT